MIEDGTRACCTAFIESMSQFDITGDIIRSSFKLVNGYIAGVALQISLSAGCFVLVNRTYGRRDILFNKIAK